MAFRGDSLPIGTRVKVIDSGKSIHGQDGCSAIFDYGVTNVGVIGNITDVENQDGISPNDPGINICVDGDTIWRIHPNSQLEIVELPSKYWIKNDGDSEEFAELFNEVFNDDISGTVDYYAILNGKPTGDYEDDTSIYPDWPVYTFEQWKSVVRPGASKKVEENITIGDKYIVLQNCKFKGKIVTVDHLSVPGSYHDFCCENGCIWSIKNGQVRKATPEEIAQAQGVFNKPVTTNEAYSDEWKVGDKLPAKWLNSSIILYELLNGNFVVYKQPSVHRTFGTNRSIEFVKNGFGKISYAHNIYLAPKQNYPTYGNNSNNSNNFSLINQSQLKNQTNEKNSSSSGSTVKDEEECIISKSRKPQGVSAYLPGDQERISVGQRRKGTAVRG